MHFDLIHSIGLAGDPAIPNDDRAGCTGNRAWVIDGATDLGPPGLMGARGGAAWLADQAQAAFAAAADAPVEALFADVGGRLIAGYAAARTREPLGRWELPIAASLAVRVDGDALDCGWLGDCVGLHHHAQGVTRLGPLRDRKDEEAARAASLAQHGLGSIRTIAAPAIEALRASRGRPGIRVLGVVPEVMANVETQRVPCALGDELLLMTDGFSALIDAYGAYDEAGLFAAVRERGLAALAEELRGIERDDAGCTRFARFKRSDDATALWLRIAG